MLLVLSLLVSFNSVYGCGKFSHACTKLNQLPFLIKALVWKLLITCGQNVPYLLLDLQVHCHVPESPIHILAPFSFKVNFNIVPSIMPSCPKWCFLFGLSNKDFSYIVHIVSHVCAICLLYLLFLDVIIIVMLGEEYKLCNSFKPRFLSSLLCLPPPHPHSQIFSSTLCFKTSSIYVLHCE